MVDLATERDITTIPKVELHVHLNGSITEATASTLARRHGADPENALRLIDGRCPGRYPNFEGFLDTYLAANEFVRTPIDLELVTAEFARAQAAQNIVYSEAIFTAMIFIRNGMEPAAMWAALRRGLVAAGPSTRVALVVDVIRDLGSTHVVRLAGLTRNGLAALQRRAARHSFATPEVKAGLLGEIETWTSGESQAPNA